MTYRLIRTPSRRQIIIRPQINPQLLPPTNQPRAQIRPLNTLHTPLHRIPTKVKRAIRILLRAKRNTQLRDAGVRLRLHDRVQQPARNQLDELAGDDLELPGGRVRVEERGARLVFGGRLQVFVEVWVFDGADPVVAGLEGCSGAVGWAAAA